MKRSRATAAFTFLLLTSAVAAQQGTTNLNEDARRRNGGPAGAMGIDAAKLPAEPMIFDTAEQHKIRVSVVARGFQHPWALSFLPDGNILVTERAGGLRIIRKGVLDPTPVRGVPEVRVTSLWGLMDVVLHPQFAQNKLIYFSYLKPMGPDRSTMAIARGRWEGDYIADLTDVFVSNPPAAGSTRLAFGVDGFLYATTTSDNMRAQDPSDLGGKILRLRDDGSVPKENPFIGREGYRPEIFSLGHRSQVGIVVHPETGSVWSTEHGRQGGDELNLILPGKNYGWPMVSYGTNYQGGRTSERPWQDGTELPAVYWVPSIGITGVTFYTGDRFPNWKNNLFVGGLQRGRISRTGRVDRVVFNEKWEEIRRESLLTELKKRVRDVRQGPDGLLYVLVEDDFSGPSGGETALLKIEPHEQ
jgi:glucose/arabinose dehydrogenase